jgi:cytochrome c peroxidase
VVAFPQIDTGKGDGVNGTEDFGRFRETGISQDLYAFRVPSLLNLEVTVPYGHAGAFASLEEVVRHYSNPVQSLDPLRRG